MTLFTKGTREKAKLRLAIIGVAGSGKTYSALRIAMGLGNRIAVLDSEHDSALKYVDEVDADGQVFTFDHMSLSQMQGRYRVENYIAGIEGAVAEGYDVLVIDSLSHAWAGPGGVLEFVDKTAEKMRNPNKFSAWKDATPLHNSLIDAMLSADIHLVVTMRSKAKFVMDGREVRKIGLEPIQRDGIEYEFDVVGDIELGSNKLIISKTRCPILAGEVIPKPGREFAETLATWLDRGSARPEPEVWDDVEIDWFHGLAEAGFDFENVIVPFLLSNDMTHPSQMTPDKRRLVLARLLKAPDKVTAFVEQTAKDLSKHFCTRFDSLHHPGPFRKKDGKDDDGKTIWAPAFDGDKEEWQAAKALSEEKRHHVQRVWYDVESLGDVTTAQATLGPYSIAFIRSGEDAFAEAVHEALQSFEGETPEPQLGD